MCKPGLSGWPSPPFFHLAWLPPLPFSLSPNWSSLKLLFFEDGYCQFKPIHWNLKGLFFSVINFKLVDCQEVQPRARPGLNSRDNLISDFSMQHRAVWRDQETGNHLTAHTFQDSSVGSSLGGLWETKHRNGQEELCLLWERGIEWGGGSR